MIYRNGKVLYWPQFTNEGGAQVATGTYQAETHSSINAAKRHVRADRLMVTRGKPPTEGAAAAVVAGINGMGDTLA